MNPADTVQSVAPGPDSICLIRLSALGDVINVVPVVRAIQAQWPRTCLTWIIGRGERALVERLPGVRLVSFDKSAGLAALRQVQRELAGERFDVLLHAQVSARANLLSCMIRARQRVGYDPARAREGHGLVVNQRIDAAPFQHQVQGFLSFARHIGVDAREPVWDLPLAESDRAFARDLLPEPGQRVLISPCSSHPGRNWHPEGYARVAESAHEQGAGPAVIMGGPGTVERDMAGAIERECRAPVVNLVGKDTLGKALAVIQRGRLLVAPDSGPVHFAAALGRPVLGLYAATWPRRSGPWGSLEHCVDRFPEAARRFRGCEPEALRWGTRIEEAGVMDLVRVEEVLEKLDRLLEITGAG